MGPKRDLWSPGRGGPRMAAPTPTGSFPTGPRGCPPARAWVWAETDRGPGGMGMPSHCHRRPATNPAGAPRGVRCACLAARGRVAAGLRPADLVCVRPAGHCQGGLPAELRALHTHTPAPALGVRGGLSPPSLGAAGLPGPAPLHCPTGTPREPPSSAETPPATPTSTVKSRRLQAPAGTLSPLRTQRRP